MPEEVQDVFGAALLDAQYGDHPEGARPFGEGLPREVMKLVEDFDGDTYRAAYTVSFPECVYVLHVFKKKSSHGIATPRPDRETIYTRLQTAKEHYRTDDRKETMSDDTTVQDSSGNVFADMGMRDAEERLAKAELARVVRKAIQERGLTQAQAAKILGVTQPDVSDLVRGRLSRFSMERLERFLNALDLEVRIQVGPRPSWKERAGITVEVVASF